MGLLNIDNISLMAFSTEDVIEQWRAEVEANERNETQVVTITEHENTHTDTYTRTDHTDYTRLATGTKIRDYAKAFSMEESTLSYGTFGLTGELARGTIFVPERLARAYTRTVQGYSQRNAYRRGAYVQYRKRNYDQYARANYAQYARANYDQYVKARYDQYSKVNHVQYARIDYDQYANNAYSENVYKRDDTTDNLVDYTQGTRYIKTDEYARDYSQYRKGAFYSDTYDEYNKYEDSYAEAGTIYERIVTGGDVARYYEQTYDPTTRYAQDYDKWVRTEDGYYTTREDVYQGDGGSSSREESGAYNAFIQNEDGTYTYGKYAGSGTAYTEYVPSYRQYSRTYSDTPTTYRQYSRASYTYTRIAARDEYSRSGYDKGFDHTNYVPSSPEVYDLEGNVISGTLDIYLASYDANNDGLGSQDQESKDIYYTVKIRQTHDLTGAEVNGEWIVLQEGAKTDGLNVDISGYEDGIYELSTQAYNSPKSEKDVSKTYVSEEKISTFTISDGGIGSTSTVLNADEFHDFIYGIETYADSEGTIKKYIDSILYDDPRLEEIGGSQKGLFMVTGLNDEEEQHSSHIQRPECRGHHRLPVRMESDKQRRWVEDQDDKIQEL